MIKFLKNIFNGIKFQCNVPDDNHMFIREGKEKTNTN